MRSGGNLSYLVEFKDGIPDGNVAWTLADGDGVVITSGAVTPVVGAVSATIEISAGSNTISGSALFEHRELSWSYTTGGSTVISDFYRYRIDAFLKFGVSANGVRNKLGIEKHELDDDQIDLVAAYYQFQATVTQAVLDAVTDPMAKLKIGNAIEALSGLRVVKTMQVKIAQKEVEGVSQFLRQKIDWAALEADLMSIVSDGYLAVDPSFDTTAAYGSIFAVVVRSPDPVTGEAPV